MKSLSIVYKVLIVCFPDIAGLVVAAVPSDEVCCAIAPPANANRPAARPIGAFEMRIVLLLYFPYAIY